jgi:hypothetical protein
MIKYFLLTDAPYPVELLRADAGNVSRKYLEPLCFI